MRSMWVIVRRHTGIIRDVADNWLYGFRNLANGTSKLVDFTNQRLIYFALPCQFPPCPRREVNFHSRKLQLLIYHSVNSLQILISLFIIIVLEKRTLIFLQFVTSLIESNNKFTIPHRSNTSLAIPSIPNREEYQFSRSWE